MYDVIKPDQLTDTYTTLGPDGATCTPPLGEIRQDDRGFSFYKFCKNVDSVVRAVGDFVCYDYANANRHEVNKPATGKLHLLAGVCMGALPIAGYGWVQIQGKSVGLVTSSASHAAGTSLKVTNAGGVSAVFDAAVDVAPVFQNHAVALAAFNPGGNATTNVLINCPNGR